MRCHRLIIGIAVACAAVPVLAQDTSAAPDEEAQTDHGIDGPLAQLPGLMFGIECRSGSLDGVIATSYCWKPGKDSAAPIDSPITSIYSYLIYRNLSYKELVERMRGNFRTAGSLKVIEEEPFTIKTAPGAVTMRGIYQTGLAGRKFTWSASFRGNFTRVELTVPNDAKMEDYEGEVMAKIFGPDRYVPDASTAQ